MENIGVIGLGAIGSRIACRLASHGYNVYANDISEEKMRFIDNKGINLSSSAAGVAANCKFIITCLTNEYSVEEVVLGESGIIESAQPGSILIETTTSSPNTTKKIAHFLCEKGVEVIDAPVSRGVPAAEKGTLSIIVGGEAETLKKCIPILENLGTDIYHVGELGSGHIVKAVNMLMLGANLIAASEVIALGEKAGLDRKKILEVLNVSSGESYITSNHFINYVLTDTYDSNFSLELMLKDIRLGMKIARDLGLPTPVSSQVEEIYTLAANSNLHSKDNMEIVPFIKELMGATS